MLFSLLFAQLEKQDANLALLILFSSLMDLAVSGHMSFKQCLHS